MLTFFFFLINKHAYYNAKGGHYW